MLFLLLFVAGLGFLVRQLAGTIFRQLAAKPIAAAITANLVLALLAAWLGFEGAIRLILLF